jgi:hypothetical protein
MNERREAISPEPTPSPSLRLLAAERVSQIQWEANEAAGELDLDLRSDRPRAATPPTSPAPSGPVGTVVAPNNRVDALQAAVVSMAAKIDELSRTTAGFGEMLTGRHLDYSDQVRRMSTITEQSLAEHREALTARDATVDRMADAVGQISRDLAAILEQVMGSLRQSREVTARNEALSQQLAEGFHRASRQLTSQGQELRDELSRAGAQRGPAPVGRSAAADDLRAEIHAAMQKLREDIGTDVTGLRQLLSRRHKEEQTESLPAQLRATRLEITQEFEALVHELHDDQVLMMREIVNSQAEIKKLRQELSGVAATRPVDGAAGQLDTEINRLLIELRALRRRPLLDAASAVAAARPTPRATPRAATPPRAPRATKSQWATRPMKGSDRSSR